MTRPDGVGGGFGLALAGLAFREQVRSGRGWRLLGLAVALSWLSSLLPVRLAQVGPAAAETLVATQILAVALLAAFLVAWPMAASDWSLASSRLGPLPLGPAGVVLGQALGQALALGLHLLGLVLAQVLGLLALSAGPQPGLASSFPWGAFLLACALVALQGLWMQGLARLLASFLPSAAATLVFVGLLLVGPAVALGAGGRFDPGFSYLGQAGLLDLDAARASWRAGLCLASAGFFNLFSARILGMRSGRLVALDREGGRA